MEGCNGASFLTLRHQQWFKSCQPTSRPAVGVARATGGKLDRFVRLEKRENEIQRSALHHAVDDPLVCREVRYPQQSIVLDHVVLGESQGEEPVLHLASDHQLVAVGRAVHGTVGEGRGAVLEDDRITRPTALDDPVESTVTNEVVASSGRLLEEVLQNTNPVLDEVRDVLSTDRDHNLCEEGVAADVGPIPRDHDLFQSTDKQDQETLILRATQDLQ